MIFYPKSYFNNVLEINFDFLQKNEIKAILLDVDNTLIDYDKKILQGVEPWVADMKMQGIKFCILSNTNKKEKVEKLSKLLDIPYFYFAKKPLRAGFKKAQNLLQVECKNIAVVGDQIMTDVLGANRASMYSILVKPIQERDIFITRIKRPIEKQILKKYFEQESKEK